MNRALRPLLFALSLLMLIAATVQAAPRERPIRLTRSQEVHRVVGSHGSGSFSYTIEGDQFCYVLQVRDLSTAPFAANIHAGPRREVGPAVAHLLTPPAQTSSVQECITAQEGGNVTPAELSALASQPASFYVNVFTSINLAGEVRGQLD